MGFETAIKKSKKLVLSMAIAGAAFAFAPMATAHAADGFYVSGTSIKDANDQQFVMRGINVAHAWYRNYTRQSIEAIAKTGANTVRIVCADGDLYDRTSQQELQQIVDWCRQNKLVAIIEAHDATGKDELKPLQDAADYWISMKDFLNKNRKYVVLNIANEWYGSWNGKAWADGYKQVIPKIRRAGIKNMLMVDSAGWGQYPDSIKNYGRSVYESDPDRNTVFSIHMYEYAGANAQTVRNNIDNSLGTGVPVVIGEFGGQHTNGDVDEDTIMSYCNQKNVGYLAWSWKGNNSDLAFLDMTNDWNGNSLTTFGNRVINGQDGIRKTSKQCSVFGNGQSGSQGGQSGSQGESRNNYVSLFWGKSQASNWGQAVSVKTTRNGGSFDAGQVTRGGKFYVEYYGRTGHLELDLQSWSGANEWAKVSPTKLGNINGRRYAEFSYDECVKAFGTSDFANKLDCVNVSAQNDSLIVYSVCYIK